MRFQSLGDAADGDTGLNRRLVLGDAPDGIRDRLERPCIVRALVPVEREPEPQPQYAPLNLRQLVCVRDEVGAVGEPRLPTECCGAVTPIEPFEALAEPPSIKITSFRFLLKIS